MIRWTSTAERAAIRPRLVDPRDLWPRFNRLPPQRRLLLCQVFGIGYSKRLRPRDLAWMGRGYRPRLEQMVRLALDEVLAAGDRTAEVAEELLRRLGDVADAGRMAGSFAAYFPPGGPKAAFWRGVAERLATSPRCADPSCGGTVVRDCCARCGVDHSEPCGVCGRAGFHAPTCSEVRGD